MAEEKKLTIKPKEFTKEELRDLRELLWDVTNLGGDCGGLVVAFLTPLPPLPFLHELEVATYWIAYYVDFDWWFPPSIRFHRSRVDPTNGDFYDYWELIGW